VIKSLLTGACELDACLEYLSSSRKRDGMSFSENKAYLNLFVYFQKFDHYKYPGELQIKILKHNCRTWLLLNREQQQLSNQVHAEIRRQTLQEWYRNFSTTNSQNILL
jgi:hypothetical protein